VKLEQFFEKFDQFADAPDAVATLRELVLDLAVQGKVADQSPDDEPAAELLQRLIAFKLANPLSGRSGRSKEGPVNVKANSDGIPANWVNTTIGEVLYVIRGASPRPKGAPQYFSETRTPYHWVKISDIRKHGQNGLLMDTDEFLTEAGMHKSVLLPKGTLVLTNSATIGVPIVLGIEGCCIHDGYLAFPNFPDDLLSQKFLLYLFHTLKKHAVRNARGLAQLNLNTDLVRSFPFGLPPLAEQKRIVAKVDELMAMCDQLEAQQQERQTRHAALARASLARFADAPTPANLHFIFHPSYAINPADLRKSILTLAVQGKLVPQDPKDESAEKLLEEIKAAREALVSERRVRQSDEVEYSRLDEAGDAPPGWVGVHVNDVAIVQGGKRLPNGAVFSESPTPHVYIRVTDMKNGTISETGLKYISPEVQREIARYIINKNDLYITIAGTIGEVGCVPASLDGHNLTENAAKIVFRGFDRQFFQLALTSEFVQAQFLEKTKQMAQPKLALKRIAGTKIYLPPLAEQRRIVDKVAELMALVDQLESQLAIARSTSSNLLSAIVSELTSIAQTAGSGKIAG
jgi:type I restriction enzyme S subunit